MAFFPHSLIYINLTCPILAIRNICYNLYAIMSGNHCIKYEPPPLNCISSHTDILSIVDVALRIQWHISTSQPLLASSHNRQSGYQIRTPLIKCKRNSRHGPIKQILSVFYLDLSLQCHISISIDIFKKSLVARKPVFGVSDRASFKPVSSATETS